jgi:hypothetical protein
MPKHPQRLFGLNGSRPPSRRFGVLLTALLVNAPIAAAAASHARADDATGNTAAPVEPGGATVTETGGPDRAHRSVVSLQGGWWAFEAEWKARPGFYVSVGIPWATVPMAVLNGATWVIPAGARVGYQYDLSTRWSLRSSAQAAFSVANETSKCGCESPAATARTFVFADLGLRYDSPRGFVAGVDVPVVGIRLPHHWFAPPEALAFSQVYVGYSWGL